MRRDVARILVVPLAASALAWLAATGAGLGQTGTTDPNQPPPPVGTTDPNQPPEPNGPIDPNQPACLAVLDPNASPPPPPPAPAPAEGWLILRGERVPWPYAVTIGADTVLVNGLPIAAPVAPVTPTSGSSPGPSSHEALFAEFWSLWRVWTSSGDLFAARLQALHWWAGADGVAAAALVPPEPPDLHVLFEGAVDPEIVSLRAPQEEQPGPWRDEFLAELAAAIEHRLGHGGLLVVEDEGLSFAPPLAESAEVFARIEAAATIPDEASRLAALREIVPDDRMARSIAQRFAAALAVQEVAHAQD